MAAVLAGGPALAGGAGSHGATAVEIPSGARPSGLGGAFTGLADDVSALFWNPAGLAHLESPEVTVMATRYLVDTRYDMAAYAQPVPGLGTFAVAVGALGYGALERRNERADGLWEEPAGTTAPRDLLVTTGWGTAFLRALGLERLKLGGAVTFASQHLTERSLLGVGVTAGALWETPLAGVRAGAQVEHMGWVAGRDEGRGMPVSGVLGGSWSGELVGPLRGAVTADLRFAAEEGGQFGVGAEIEADEIASLRAGWRGGGPLGGPACGVGLRTPSGWFGRRVALQFDYAIATSGELGTSHRFQVSARRGGRRRIVLGGALRVGREGGEPVLTWNGAASGYLVQARRIEEAGFSQLTDSPVRETRYGLTGLSSGRYVFRVVPVDDAGEPVGIDAMQIEVTLEADESAPGP